MDLFQVKDAEGYIKLSQAIVTTTKGDVSDVPGETTTSGRILAISRDMEAEKKDCSIRKSLV